ncbi:MAG: MerR family transcriptional regulator, light-induced transcriptional regulator [Solirubrobacteraceae bacterium]|nr:MerR family transcriptional regulator, light-induced transcriptional regulator [Solirubrobacteraceae bacterium]
MTVAGEYGDRREEMGHPRENDSHEPYEAQIAELASAYAAALLSGNEVAAETAIREAMDAELSTADIQEKVMAPALWLVGDLWERGKLSVAEEHIATEISVRVLTLQQEAQRVAESRQTSRVMLATPSGELHVVALRMVANLLRGAGYDTVMVGPDVPGRTLGAVARLHRAEVICMSATMSAQTTEVVSTIDEVRHVWPSAGFVVGGRGLSLQRQPRAEVYVCARVSEAVEAVDAMVKRAGLN